MTALYAPHYRSVSQLVEEAIERSKTHNEIVHIELDGHLIKVKEELDCECEGSVETNEGWAEFWGRDIDGGKWRIHISE